MKNQIATTPEQSRRLAACGVNPASADMVWLNRGKLEPFLTFNEGCNRAIPEVGDIPAWSLGALLALLPKELYEHDTDELYYFSLAKDYVLMEDYGASYLPCWDNGEALVRKHDESPIEACVLLIEWLVGERYKPNYDGKQ